MNLARILALILLFSGLLVQVSAQAAAMPSAEMAQSMDCEEMQATMTDGTVGQDEPSGSRGPCDQMTLGCLVAMNCVSPLLMGDGSAATFQRFIDSQSFSPVTANTLFSQPLAPEAPPPRL